MFSKVGSLLEQIISEQLKEDTVALLLSGGVDSLSCGFAAQALGKRVHAYTFQIENQTSEDSRVAVFAARKLGWEFTLVRVQTKRLEEDFLELAGKWECKKKTQFECTYPFLYLIPQITEKYVLSGIAADGHFGLSKKAMMHFKTPKEKFDEFRTKYFSSPNPAGQLQQKALIESYGKIQIAPYLDKRMFDYFIQFDWNEINEPVQKRLTVFAYTNLFRTVGIRPHKNLQLVAGIPSIFERLLSSRLNKKNRTRVMDLCRDYSGYKGGEDDD